MQIKYLGYFVPIIIIIALLSFLSYILLGYSFNDGESSYFVKPDYQTNNRYEIKYSNGVYSGIGAGVQYGPFVLDLSYNINSFKTREKIEYNWGTRNNTLESKNHKTTIKAVTLSAGVVLDLSGF